MTCGARTPKSESPVSRLLRLRINGLFALAGGARPWACFGKPEKEAPPLPGALITLLRAHFGLGQFVLAQHELQTVAGLPHPLPLIARPAALEEHRGQLV